MSMPQLLFMRFSSVFTVLTNLLLSATIRWICAKRMKIFSKEMVCPRYRMVAIGRGTRSRRRKVPCCGCGLCSSGNLPALATWVRRRSIFRTTKSVKEIFQRYQRLQSAQSEWPFPSHLQSLQTRFNACTSAFQERSVPWVHSYWQALFYWSWACIRRISSNNLWQHSS